MFGSLASSVLPENGLLQKLGIFGFALAMCLIILILVLGIRRLVKIEKLRMILDKIKLMICWNMVIKCLQGGFLAYCTSAITVLTTAPTLQNLYSSSKITERVISMFIMLLLILAVCLQFIFTMLNEPIQLIKSRDKFGSIYTGVDVYRKSALFQCSLFYILRFLYAATLNIPEPFGLKIHELLIVTMIQTSFILKVRPNMTRLEWQVDGHYLELFNYFSLLLAIFLKVLFTEYVLNENLRFSIGWVYVGLIVLMIIANLSNMVKVLIEKKIRMKIFMCKKK